MKYLGGIAEGGIQYTVYGTSYTVHGIHGIRYGYNRTLSHTVP